jgi:hypothetical protein
MAEGVVTITRASLFASVLIHRLHQYTSESEANILLDHASASFAILLGSAMLSAGRWDCAPPDSMAYLAQRNPYNSYRARIIEATKSSVRDYLLSMCPMLLHATGGYGLNFLDVAQLLQSDLKDGGIEAELKVQEYGAYLNQTVYDLST